MNIFWSPASSNGQALISFLELAPRANTKQWYLERCSLLVQALQLGRLPLTQPDAVDGNCMTADRAEGDSPPRTPHRSRYHGASRTVWIAIAVALAIAVIAWWRILMVD